MSVELHRLSNGLRIVVEPMPHLHSASLGLYVTAGGRHERLEQNGIAHFLEHMAFKGTPTRTARAIAEEIEDVGGYINAYTGKEMTAYYARVLAANVEDTLDLLVDIVLNPLFDRADIELERGVILQEIGQANDTPDDIIFDWLQDLAFPEQPLGRAILGPAEKVSRFGAEDLAGFTNEHYGPEHIIVSAAGAVDADAFIRAAEARLGHLTRRESRPADAGIFAGGERRTVRDLEQAHLAIGFHSPGILADDVYTAQLFATLMGGGMSSRLFQELRERRGLCYSIFAQTGAYSDTGLTTIYAGTGPDQADTLGLVIMDELRRAADGVSEAELERARAQMRAGLLMSLESPSSRSERLARALSIWDRIPSVEEVVARIEQVSVQDLGAFAQSFVANADPALVLLGPEGPKLDKSMLSARLAA